MEIILKQDVANLGKEGEIVKVKNGYARNYLIPRGFACLATESKKKMYAEIQRQKAQKEERIKKQAQETAEKLKNMELIIETKASSTGKIFGSVTNIQIAHAIADKGIKVERKNISIIDEPIKNLGEYTANIKLHKDIEIKIKFKVIGV